MGTQISTILFVEYPNIQSKVWAFGMMQFGHQYLQNVKGLHFYKLMGVGKGLGFNPRPNWSLYSLWQIWDSEADAQAFFAQNPLIQKYKNRGSQHGVIWLKNLQSHGLWDKKNPFIANTSHDPALIAVLTRATIKPSKLRTFWKYVPTTEAAIREAKGLLFTKGIGEVPLLNMATFSIWDSIASVKAYAYKNQAHAKAIKMTRDLDWYSEELFARFVPYQKSGTWDAIKTLPLPTLDT